MGVNLEVFHGFGRRVFTNAAPLGLGSLGLMPATQMPPRWG